MCYLRQYRGVGSKLSASSLASRLGRSLETHAEIQRRIAIYAERIARGEPLFENMEEIWNSIPRSA
jgi:hypothetical protein